MKASLASPYEVSLHGVHAARERAASANRKSRVSQVSWVSALSGATQKTHKSRGTVPPDVVLFMTFHDNFQSLFDTFREFFLCLS